MEPIDVPLSLVVPARLSKQASRASCGLFFPYATRPPMGLVVDWDGETHLIHLAGTDLFKEAGIDVGRSISGGMINDIEYRVDVTSLYNSVERADPAGALVLKAGELHLYCSRLGDRI